MLDLGMIFVQIPVMFDHRRYLSFLGGASVRWRINARLARDIIRPPCGRRQQLFFHTIFDIGLRLIEASFRIEGRNLSKNTSNTGKFSRSPGIGPTVVAVDLPDDPAFWATMVIRLKNLSPFSISNAT